MLMCLLAAVSSRVMLWCNQAVSAVTHIMEKSNKEKHRITA